MSHFKFVKRAERFSAMLIAMFAIILSLLVACDGQHRLCNEDDQQCQEVNDEGNAPPFAEMITPVQGANIPAGNVELTARATDTKGEISTVEFYRRGDAGQDIWLGFGDRIPGTDHWKFVWENVGVGSYTVHAVAIDNDGAPYGSVKITFTTVASAPVCHVEVPEGIAYETGQRGLFKVVCDRVVTQGTEINYEMSGTATFSDNGRDYAVTAHNCNGTTCRWVFTENTDHVWIGVWATDDGVFEPGDDETAILMLLPRTGYSVGTPASGVMLIRDKRLPPNFGVGADSSSVNSGQCTMVRLDIISDVTSCVAIGGVAGDGWAGVIANTDTNRQVCPTGASVSYGWHCTAPSGVQAEQFVSVSVNQPTLTTVTVQVIDNTATETGETSGVIRFTRTGSTAAPLLVTYNQGGTATSGFDYYALQGNITISSGASSVDLEVKAKDDTVVEVLETVVITVPASAQYNTLAGQNTATVNIVDNDATAGMFICPGGAANFTQAEVDTIEGTTCSGWGQNVNGQRVLAGTYPKGMRVPYGTGVCAVTCVMHNGNGLNVTPTSCESNWWAFVGPSTATYAKSGCSALMGHEGEPVPQAGCATDDLCSVATTCLWGPCTPPPAMKIHPKWSSHPLDNDQQVGMCMMQMGSPTP
jgi:hypothetical protein